MGKHPVLAALHKGLGALRLINYIIRRSPEHQARYRIYVEEKLIVLRRRRRRRICAQARVLLSSPTRPNQT
jgi:hypothetical protein